LGNRAVMSVAYMQVWTFYAQNLTYNYERNVCIQGHVSPDSADVPEALNAIKNKDPEVEYVGIKDWGLSGFTYKFTFRNREVYFRYFGKDKLPVNT
jgi:hypothetical protein